MTVSERDGLAWVTSEAFLRDRDVVTRRWNKEWMRYFSSGKDYGFYFYDMDTPNYALRLKPDAIAALSPREMFETKLFKQTPGAVWLAGREFVGKDVLEVGCGPGILGRISSRYVRSYTGLDASTFALSIAELTSPPRCTYEHIYAGEALGAYRDRFDTAYGRHFFIHHNYADSVWLLAMMRDMTKPGGVVHADFFGHEGSVDGDRRVEASADLSADHPSSLYYFSDASIRRIADEVGLNLEDVHYHEPAQVKFCRLRVPE